MLRGGENAQLTEQGLAKLRPGRVEQTKKMVGGAWGYRFGKKEDFEFLLGWMHD